MMRLMTSKWQFCKIRDTSWALPLLMEVQPLRPLLSSSEILHHHEFPSSDVM